MRLQLHDAPRPWQAIAADLGFAPPRAGGRRKRRARSANGRFIRDPVAHDERTRDLLTHRELARNGMRLRARGGWLEAVLPAPEARGDGSPRGAPGLWRCVGSGGARARIFEIPPAAWAGAAAEDETHACDEPGDAAGRALGALLDWAQATAGGEAPASWCAPAREELDEWLASRRLFARADGQVAQGEIVCERDRLALALPALAKPAAALDSAREAWLRALCRDAEEHWRLVRVGVDPQDGGVRAEIDLTGVPAQCARPLALLSLEALVCAAEWVLPSLALVIDPSVESRVLDRHPEAPFA